MNRAQAPNIVHAMSTSITDQERLFKEFAIDARNAVTMALQYYDKGDYISASVMLQSAELTATRTYREFIKLRDLLGK